MEPDSREGAFAWVTLAYAVAIGVALGAGVWANGRYPGLHPLWIVAIADLAGTLVIFGFSFGFGNSSFYDAYWSVAPPLIASYLALVPEAIGGDRARLLVVFTLVAFWAVRLTWNWARGWTGLGHEDWRYVDLKAKSGRLYWLVSLGGIHLFPTLQVWLACLPLYAALVSPQAFGWLDGLAGVVTLAGIGFELVADNQLRRFVHSKPPQGALLDTGLWAWSRHPNYFGEMSFWWGIWLFGLAADPSFWWTVIGPLAITLMFRFASLPMIEERMAARRPGWAAYAARVRIVLPLPSRRA